MTIELGSRSHVNPDSSVEKLCQRTWSLLLAGQQLELDQLCKIAGRPATDPGTRLNTIQELLFHICAGVWKPESTGAKQALFVICSFLHSLGSDRSAHKLSRVRAYAFLLKGIELELWSVSPEVYGTIDRYIGHCS